jgi:hypothetical protein
MRERDVRRDEGQADVDRLQASEHADLGSAVPIGGLDSAETNEQGGTA